MDLLVGYDSDDSEEETELKPKGLRSYKYSLCYIVDVTVVLSELRLHRSFYRGN